MLAGWLLFGKKVSGSSFSPARHLLVEPATASRLTQKLYRACPIAPHEAPELYRIMAFLSDRAGLAHMPTLLYRKPDGERIHGRQ